MTMIHDSKSAKTDRTIDCRMPDAGPTPSGKKRGWKRLVADDIKKSRCDHAMGLQVKNGFGTCFNNGYDGGSATFSVDNLARQMIGLKACYVVNL